MQHGDGISDTDVPLITRKPRARRLVLCVGVGLAVLVAVGVLVFIRVSTPPWDEMERSLNSFPVPAGLNVVDRNRQGEGCFHSIDPGCPTPLLFFWVVADGSGSHPDCSTLTEAVSHWNRFANEARSPSGACEYDGAVDGYPVAVRLVDNSGAGGGRGNEIEVSMSP